MIPVVPGRRALWLLAAASALFLWSPVAGLTADLLVLALAYWDGRRTRAPIVSRRVPSASSLGRAMAVSVMVTNEERRPVRIRATDDLDPRLE